MSFIELMKKEQGLLEVILTKHDTKVSACISSTCSLFQKIVKEDMSIHHNEYTKKRIPELFDEIVTNKMLSFITKKSEYKTLVEYDEDIEELSKQINDNNYDDILSRMKDTHNDYLIDTYTCGKYSYVFEYIENEYANFITNVLKHNLEKNYDYQYDDEEEN